MFELGMNNAGKANAVRYDAIKQKIKEIGQEIMLEIFCNKYQKAYAGEKLSVK